VRPLSILLLTAVCLFVSKSSSGEANLSQAVPKLDAGPAEGEPAPPFKALDQFGNEQTNKTIAGKNGTVLLFFRSADW